MGRPRKYVRIINGPDGPELSPNGHGREVSGLVYRRTTPKGRKPERGIFSRYDDEGNRIDLGSDLRAALAVVEPTTALDPHPVIDDWSPYYGGGGSEVAFEIAGYKEGFKAGVAAARATAETEPIPIMLPERIPQWPPASEGKPVDVVRPTKQRGEQIVTPTSDATLADLIETFKAEQTKLGRKPKTIRDTLSLFKQFVNALGETKPLAEITANDIDHAENVILAVYRAEKKDPSWYKKVWAKVGHMLRLGKRKRLGIAIGTLEWVESVTTEVSPNKKPKPARQANNAPLPVNVFKATLVNCRKLADSNNGLDKRNAVQLPAMLHLAINCGFLNEDLSTLTIAHLHLDSEIPYTDLPRWKASTKVGKPNPRMIPLAKATVEALREWLDLMPPRDNGIVFRSSDTRWDRDAIGKAFNGEAYKNRAPLIPKGWKFKSCRNVANTVRRNAKLPVEMATHLLGNSERLVANKYYLGEADETYLLPLVNLIAETYFDD